MVLSEICFNMANMWAATCPKKDGLDFQQTKIVSESFKL